MFYRQTIIVSAVAGLLLASASGDEPIPLPDDGPRDYHAKYAVIVGVDDYSHGQGLPNLQYAANDAREFRKLLVEEFGYDDGRILYLTDAKGEPGGVVDGPPTFEAIRDAFDKWLPSRGLTADDYDSVLFFFAGHGLSDDATGTGYLVAADSRAGDKENTCIPVEWLRNRLGSKNKKAVPCRHRLMLLDCCYSGTLFSQPLVARPGPPATPPEGGRPNGAGPGALPPTRGGGPRAARGSGEVSYYLTREAYVGMTAGLGDQPVIDGTGKDQHSFFTKELLQAMRERANSAREDHVFTFTELASVVRPRVAAAVLKLNPLLEQIPMAGRIEAGEGDFVFHQSIDREVPWERAEREARIADAQRLAAQSTAERTATPPHPQRSLLLAVEAVRATMDYYEDFVAPTAKQALHDAFGFIQGRFLGSHDGAVKHLAFAPDGRLITAGDDGTVRVWNLAKPRAKPLVFKGFQGKIEAIAIAPDGRLAFAGADGEIWGEATAPNQLKIVGPNGAAWVWDLANPGVKPLVVARHKDMILDLAFAPDGRLVTAGRDGTTRVWDLSKPGAEPLVLTGHHGAIGALAFAPDGRLVTGGVEGVEVWDLNNLRAGSQALAGPQGFLFRIGFAPDGRLVTASSGGVGVWDLSKPGAEPLRLPPHGQGINALAFAPDGRLATAGMDGKARIWDLKAPRAEPLVLAGHDGVINALAFASDGRLVTASDDRTVRVWDPSKPGVPPLVLAGHDGVINALAFAPDGQLITVSDDHTARVWDLDSPRAEPLVLAGHKDWILDLAYAPDGRLATAGRDGTVQVWDPSKPEAEPLVLTGGRIVTALAFAPDGRLAAAGDRTARVWDLSKPRAEPLVLRGDDDSIKDLAFARDGRLAIVASKLLGNRSTLMVWDLKGLRAEPLVRIDIFVSINALAFAPDGRLATAGMDGKARIWDLKAPRAEPLVLAGHDGVINALAFAPDGRLATAGSDRTARVWNLNDTKHQPLILHGHISSINSLAFSPDGRLATADADSKSGTVRVWDLSKPQEAPILLSGHVEEIKAVVFASDGRLATAGRDGKVRVWDLDVRRLIQRAAPVVGRNLSWVEWEQYFGTNIQSYRKTFENLPDGEGVEERRMTSSEGSR